MIPVWEPVLDGNEKRYVLDCLETNWISSLGSYITRFEETMARWCGVPHAVACSSCTTGLHLALTALGIGPGDEVLIPDFTLIVSANTVIQAGARPVLVDADPKTWCIDPAKIEAKVGPRSRAIMPVHMYGHPCDMEAILSIARRHGLLVIEDCAEAHGARIGDRPVGSFGDAACFSFYGNKILTTGEGGMVLCSDPALADRMRLLRNQAFDHPRFVHREVGFNYRLTNVQAAIGLAQAERADEKVERKREIARWYAEAFAGVEDVELPWEAPGAKNVYWMYSVVLEHGNRVQVMERLRSENIETRPFFVPLHQQPLYAAACRGERFPIAEEVAAGGLNLPSGNELTEATVERLATALRAALG